MRQYIKFFARGLSGFLLALAMAGLTQASAALLPIGSPDQRISLVAKLEKDSHVNGPADKAHCSGKIIIAQKIAPAPVKPQSPPVSKEESAISPREPASLPRMERSSKSIRPDADLERAGTKRLGGEIIRHKDDTRSGE
jgi:hypothetical protein